MSNLFVAVLVAAPVIALFAYLCMLMFHSCGKPDSQMNHKRYGLVYKPVIVTDKIDGSQRYAVRVYALWGLRETEWFLRETSRHKDWDVCSFRNANRVFFKTSEGVTSLIKNLTPPEDQVTVETRTVEELKLEDLLSDD
ncbi:hypothetical protein HYP06_gp101 [Vibrio phage vB_VspP_pVa5]|uniref:Uncharacterized protein n=1 Tax=Vibrio phage vB_VspP_pVa5 TaxID=1913109 RepID=A0A1J0GV58_9CAUD|nr:hypothetical protein HYP06_gp101 [Vibrio phage vB_VspP_pVa5]APC46063.1 hypothetical protein vBVspPpVa5_0072 [Vibrio phage vB_VspP_pVa5]